MDILYTTTQAVRAVLGVSDRELSDTQITDLSIVSQLEVELETVYPDHAALKVKIDNNTATDAEKNTWKKLLLYVQYEGAVMLLPALQMWAVQKITDGDFEIQRFMKDNLQETIDRIMGRRDEFMIAVNPALALDGAGFKALTTATPDYDPVTNV